MNTAYATLNSLCLSSSTLFPLYSPFHIPAPGGWLNQTLGFFLYILEAFLMSHFSILPYFTIQFNSLSCSTPSLSLTLPFTHFSSYDKMILSSTFAFMLFSFSIQMFSEQVTVSKLSYNINFSMRSYFLASHLYFVLSAP